MIKEFTYQAQGRSLRGGLAILGIWLGLLLLWIGLQAHPLIVLFLGGFTLPACWDFIQNPDYGLTLGTDTFSWHSGKRRAEVLLSEIDHVRMDTRLDFSVRTTLVLTTGAKLRLPFEATPPHHAFEQTLNDRGLKTRRTHFQLMQ